MLYQRKETNVKRALVKKALETTETTLKDNSDDFYTEYARLVKQGFQDEIDSRKISMNCGFVEIRLKAILRRGGIMWLVKMATDPVKCLMGIGADNNYNLASYIMMDLIDGPPTKEEVQKLVENIRIGGHAWISLIRIQELVKEEIERRDARS